jgi:hypothetical protein
MDKAALFTQTLEEEDVEIPGVGTVRVRALTRSEAMKIRGREMAVDAMERYLLAAAMVQPRLTEEEVRRWQDAAPAGQLEPVCRAVQRLSGLEEAAARQAYHQFRDDTGS